MSKKYLYKITKYKNKLLLLGGFNANIVTFMGIKFIDIPFQNVVQTILYVTDSMFKYYIDTHDINNYIKYLSLDKKILDEYNINIYNKYHPIRDPGEAFNIEEDEFVNIKYNIVETSNKFINIFIIYGKYFISVNDEHNPIQNESITNIKIVNKKYFSTNIANDLFFSKNIGNVPEFYVNAVLRIFEEKKTILKNILDKIILKENILLFDNLKSKSINIDYNQKNSFEKILFLVNSDSKINFTNHFPDLNPPLFDNDYSGSIDIDKIEKLRSLILVDKTYDIDLYKKNWNIIYQNQLSVFSGIIEKYYSNLSSKELEEITKNYNDSEKDTLIRELIIRNMWQNDNYTSYTTDDISVIYRGISYIGDELNSSTGFYLFKSLRSYTYNLDVAARFTNYFNILKVYMPKNTKYLNFNKGFLDKIEAEILFCDGIILYIFSKKTELIFNEKSKKFYVYTVTSALFVGKLEPQDYYPIPDPDGYYKLNSIV
jgi:hypothetical protein